MEETLVFIQQHQAWINILLGAAGLVYLRLAWRWYQELRRALFGLEREQALDRLRRAAAMLTFVVAALASTFVISTFVTPAMPGSGMAPPIPTVSLLATAHESTPPAGPGFEAATALPAAGLDSSGCLNPDATLTQPQTGDTLSGVVEILGTANIPSFGFYKIEYRSLADGTVWRAILAGDSPVFGESLGSWDTSLVLPGEYAFRLVVADTAGNAPMPCVITVRVAPVP
jgi:hypothetical protein